jgi:hypothetical protein
VEEIIQKIKAHVPGMGCACAAHDECECGCDVDWMGRREMAYNEALKYCLGILKHHHKSRPGIIQLIEETEKIVKAGEYRYGQETN